MEYLQGITILGRDHDAKGEVYLQSLDSLPVALGTSAGTTAKPNEDAVGVSALGTELVLAIADGHWGREAAEIGVSKAMELLSSESPPVAEKEIQARLFSLFEQVNDQLYDLASSTLDAVTPETTLIVCHIRELEYGKVLYWASFGDSYLFLLRKQMLNQLNSLNPRWLGYLSKLSEKPDTRALLMRFLTDDVRYVGVANGMETGIEKLEPGDIVFLCTDGLIGVDRDPNPAQLYGIRMLLMSDLSISAKVEKAIAAALARGEKDNITCLAALIPAKLAPAT
jgi:serine/threonine protein phosphatase PrpC